LDKKRQLALNNFLRARDIGGANSRLSEKEKEFNVLDNELKLLAEKDIAQRNVRKEKLKQACEPLENERRQASDKIEKEMIEDYKKNVLCPVSQVVQFEFIVYPDGKNFEIASFSNESWSKLGLDLGVVLNVIFAK